MIDLQDTTNIDELESQLYFPIIDCIQLRNELTTKVKSAKNSRKETQKELSEWLNISLTKIKEIENGACKDFNAINNYINYLGKGLIYL